MHGDYWDLPAVCGVNGWYPAVIDAQVSRRYHIVDLLCCNGCCLIVGSRAFERSGFYVGGCNETGHSNAKVVWMVKLRVPHKICVKLKVCLATGCSPSLYDKAQVLRA